MTGFSKFTTLFVATALVLVSACDGGEEEGAAQAAQQVQEAAQAAQAQASEAAQAAQAQAAQAAQAAQQATNTAAAAGTSNFGTITLEAGFTPDPHKVQGTSGGATDAATVNPSCNGYIADTPDHLFVAQGAFSGLRIMAKSEGDITLVIQKPDNTYLCNDDSDGTNPLVAGEFPAGTYKVWVGSYEQGTNSAYTLGLSELDEITPSSL